MQSTLNAGPNFRDHLSDLVDLGSKTIGIIEDFAKLAGYALWSAYWIVFAFREVRRELSQS